MTEKGDRWLPTYRRYPEGWTTHPRKAMLMTPMLIFFGGIFAFAVPTLVAAFFQMFFFDPPVSGEWSPLTARALEGQRIYVANGCVYCHSGYTRPQDVRSGLYYTYPRISLPGDYVTSDSSPNVFGSARIGPDLSQEGGFHPDDWQRAHYSDPRYTTPLSIMPRFSFLSDQEVDDLILYAQMRSGKSGLVRYAGQVYAKRVMKAVMDFGDPPAMSVAEDMALADVARMVKMNPPEPPSGGVGDLGWPAPMNLFLTDRSFWLTGNPLPVTDDNLLRGRKVFQERCIGCHGQGGSAVSLATRYLRPTPIDFTSKDDASGGEDTSPGDLYYRVLRGIRGSAMENFGTRLRVDDVWRVVLFLKTIPNGGLEEGTVPSVDQYIQWQPPDTLMSFVEQFPLEDYTQFTQSSPTIDPWMLEAERVFAGMTPGDEIQVPSIGTFSLQVARDGIKAVYDDLLQQGWADYQQRGGVPTVPESQRSIEPELIEELR